MAEETSVELEETSDAVVDEAIDPGQHEGMPKEKIDPRDTAPPEHTKRWKEIYKKSKQYDEMLPTFEGMKKDIEALQGQVKVIDALKEHNAHLVAAIEKGSPKETKDDVVESLKGKLADLKKRRVEAREKLDFKAQDDIEDQIDEVKEQIREAKSAKKTPSKSGEQFPEDMVAAFNEFADSTPWFKKDSVMQGAAYAVDAQLAKDPKWKDKPYSERFAEVRRVVEERFGVKTDDSGDQKVDGVETGGTRVTTVKGRRVVKLNQTQLDIAKGLGITPEEMAAQVAAIDGGKK